MHVPWCRTRCPYCAFNTYVDPAAPFARWAAGIRRDWALVAEGFEGPAHSVFFGGGTPSLLPPAVLGEVLAALAVPTSAEVTAEMNPGDLDRERLRAFREAGVNRVSVGVQTFHPRFGGLLNRGHTVEAARELVALVREGGFRSWSVDVIFGLPGQTVEDFAVDLQAILEVRPPHVSLYGLTLEPGTPFERAWREGRLELPDEEVWAAQYELALDTLERQGLERYELSNFALPGHRAVHNERVWRGGHYAGLGPGAHGFLPDGRRTVATLDPAAWEQTPYGAVEHPSAEEQALDLLLTTTRHVDGLELERLRGLGFALDEAAVERLVVAGRLERAGTPPTQLRLTRRGAPVADAVIRALAAALVALPASTP